MATTVKKKNSNQSINDGQKKAARKNTVKSNKNRTQTGKTNTRKKKKSNSSQNNTLHLVQKKKKQEELFDFPMSKELAVLASITLFILAFVSCFVDYDNALYWLKQLQLGMLGIMGYVVPIVAIIVVIWFYCQGFQLKNRIKLLGIILMIFSFCSMLQIYSKEGFYVNNSIVYYFVVGQSGIGGGLIGALLLKLLYPALGDIGSTIVLLFFLVAATMLLTEKSVMELVRWCAQDWHRMIVALRQSGKQKKKGQQSKQKETKLAQAKKEISLVKEKKELEIKKESEIEQEPIKEAAVLKETKKKEQKKASLFEKMTHLIPIDNEWDDDFEEEEKQEKAVKPKLIIEGSEEDNEDEFVSDSSAVKVSPEQENMDSQWMDENSLQKDNVPQQEEDDSAPLDKVAAARKNSWQSKQNEKQGGRKMTDNDQYKTVEMANGTTRTVVKNGIPGEQLPPKERKKAKEQEDQTISLLKENRDVKYQLPPTDLLGKEKVVKRSQEELQQTAEKLQEVFDSFGVNVTITKASCGPAVTRYELQPAQGVKVSRIVALSDDIKLNLAAADIRIEAPIPGKAAVGIEVPNKENSIVSLRNLLEDRSFQNNTSKITFAVGKDIGGNNLIADIAKMPHLLIAGATGSGKSVCINTLIISILYRAKPEDVRLILIDPKVVELSVYNGIPHLLLPVVTDPKKAANALSWAVAEMTRRYQAFAKESVRDIKGYNKKVDAGEVLENGEKAAKMPKIVIIVDELADLMMVAPGDVEDSICRLAQLARAAGIHLVIATQRPSVNVITGIIKANMPSRIAFAVTSGVDSRTILDMNGAEKLLGKGDMLFHPSGYPKPVRVQGAFVSDQEVSKVAEFWKNQVGDNSKKENVQAYEQLRMSMDEPSGTTSERDELFEQAGRAIIEKEKASIGMLQRMFKIGFNRAARIMDQLHEAGVVGEEEGTKPRKILLTMEEFEELLKSR